jgi:tetratricopeptide (TPR) repeat protein
MENNQLTNEELRNIGFYHTNRESGSLLFGFSVLHEIQKKFPKDAILLEQLADASERLNFNTEALVYRKMLLELKPEDPHALAKYAWLKYINDRKLATVLTPIDMRESENILKKSILLTADTVDIFCLRLADLYYGTQQYAKAILQYKRVIELHKTRDGDPTIHDDLVFMQLANCHSRLSQYGIAFGYAMQAVNGNPKNEEARDMIYEIWIKGVNPAKRR